MIILCILDGWGEGVESPDNAIFVTPTPNWDEFCKTGSLASLQASEHYVGLPDKQIGNSEVGHANIGCGRVLLQDLPRINAAIEAGSHIANPDLLEAVTKLKASGGTAHIIGLLSEGGVHSHQHHLQSYAKLLKEKGVPVKVHAITDGRDTAPDNAPQALEAYNKTCGDIPIATISGRFYAMDRDNNWERTHQAYDAIALGQGEKFATAEEAITHFADNDILDEYIPPSVIGEASPIKDGDAVLFMNFRSDRIQAIAKMFCGLESVTPPKLVAKIGLTSYSNELSEHLGVLFPPENPTHSLGEVISAAGLKQLRIAETEKYAHVTYFFNGNNESEFAGEDRILVPSPKVQSYDLKPEMAAYDVLEKLQAAIESKKYDLLVVNFANPDMVGHTGNLEASKKAVAVIDDVLGKLWGTAKSENADLLITADHGNIEKLKADNGKRHTSHTVNPVPFVLLGRKFSLQNGSLCDIAPTILALMGLEKPTQMSGKSLLL